MMALATRIEVKAALGISDTSQDDKIDALLEPITSLIEQAAGRAFTSATVTERYMGGEPTIALKRYPVTSITSVTDKITGQALAATDYALEAATGLLRRLPLGSSWSAAYGPRIVYLGNTPQVGRWEIVYVGGATSVPGDVLFAYYETFAAVLAGQGGMQSEKDGDYSYVRGASVGAVPASAMAALQSYKAGVFF
jgi:hypothetical protein